MRFKCSIASGSTAIWSNGFITGNGAAAVAANFGALATSGTNIAGQPIYLGYFNSAGVNYAMQLQASGNALGVTSTGLADGVAIGGAGGGNPFLQAIGSDTNINLDLFAKGTGGIVANNTPERIGDDSGDFDRHRRNR